MGSLKHECIVSNTYISAYSLCSYRKYIFGSCVKKKVWKIPFTVQKMELLQTTTYTTQLQHTLRLSPWKGDSHITPSHSAWGSTSDKNCHFYKRVTGAMYQVSILTTYFKCISHINTFCPPSSNWNLCKISLYMKQCTLLKSLHCLKELSEPSFRYWMWQC